TDSLALSETQAAGVRSVYQDMKAEARWLGARIVEHEARLDSLFASGRISEASLEDLITAIGALQGR
ncbi:hypothetical protein, partial [Hydrogenophaga sp.]|uniref:hypothetical protein n=1 Tax=Hydrogenophaga sp. TaxID=1904254 RepID=UPI0016950851